MALAINSIESRKSNKKKKRVGRGNASGHGTYSCRGLKGQNCRSGVSRLKLKKIGMKHGRSAMRGVPKLRGFKSLKQKNQIVKVGDINKNFQAGDEVSKDTLLKKGLIDKINVSVKILGKDEMIKVNLADIKKSN